MGSKTYSPGPTPLDGFHTGVALIFMGAGSQSASLLIGVFRQKANQEAQVASPGGPGLVSVDAMVAAVKEVKWCCQRDGSSSGGVTDYSRNPILLSACRALPVCRRLPRLGRLATGRAPT